MFPEFVKHLVKRVIGITQSWFAPWIEAETLSTLDKFFVREFSGLFLLTALITFNTS